MPTTILPERRETPLTSRGVHGSLGFFLHMQAPPRLRHRMLQGLGEGSIWGAPSLLSPPVVRGPGGPVHQRNLLPRNIFGRQASVQRYDIVLYTHTDMLIC